MTCPVCSSDHLYLHTVAGVAMEFCLDCSAFWEAEQRTEATQHRPCDNCAFRAGSPERRDPEKWEDLLTALYTGRFYCHKRVPCAADDTGYRFLVEIDSKGKATNARICMGYLSFCLGHLNREKVSTP